MQQLILSFPRVKSRIGNRPITEIDYVMLVLDETVVESIKSSGHTFPQFFRLHPLKQQSNAVARCTNCGEKMVVSPSGELVEGDVTTPCLQFEDIPLRHAA